jgi:hypothetical protein
MHKVQRLQHGGIMANYQCNAACRHCLYACSPKRSGGYITQATAEAVCELLRAGGCRSVHIGGGEPFLNFEGLLDLVRTVTDAGIAVEYIETNAFWATDRQQVVERLNALIRAGADAFCISSDPYHAEYVRAELPLGLAKMCRDTGFRHFMWQTDRHSLRFGGRAINIEAEYNLRKPVDVVMSSQPCGGLLSGGHFHVDLYGRYIPPGCTGIAIPLDEAIHGIPDGKYPVFETLLSGGSVELLRYAEERGFTTDPEGYPSRCALCFHIRRWLSEHASSPELDAEHYTEAMKCAHTTR